MAREFVRDGQIIDTADADVTIYTVPTGKRVIILGLRAANTDPAVSINYSIKNTIESGLAGERDCFLTGADSPLPVGSADIVSSGEKIILLEDDVLSARCNTADALSVSFSFVVEDNA